MSQPRLQRDAQQREMVMRRTRLLSVLIISAFLVVLGRYFYLQVIEHEQFQTRSEANRQQIRPLPPSRGLIYDRNGVLLAQNLPAYRLEIIPEQVDDLAAVVETLRGLVDLSEQQIEDFHRARRARRPFDPVPLRFRLSDDELARVAVNRHRLPGVEVSPYLQRHYPLDGLMTHVVGYVGRVDRDDLQNLDAGRYAATSHVGKSGIERYYEDLLHGQPGLERIEANARGRRIRVLDHRPSKPGRDLYLTIDVRLQAAASRALSNKTGAVVAIDPSSGEILAMVSQPSYSPNLFVSGIDQASYDQLVNSPDQPLFNRALRGRYHPGSTIKPFLALAALEAGIDDPNHTIVSRGYYQLPGQRRRYHDWREGGHGEVDVVEALAQSVNVYFYDLAVRMGIDQIATGLSPFGFGQASGVDLPGEAIGILPSREWKQAARGEPWYQGETVITGIGQGFTLVTPVQLAAATAILANGGASPLPHLRLAPPPAQGVEVRSVILNHPEYLAKVYEGMTQVVHGENGTARAIASGLSSRMAGKTGTSQVFSRAIDEESREQEELPEHLRNHAWFIGFAPVETPSIAVAVIVEHGGSGSSAAAPVAADVVESWLQLQQTQQRRHQAQTVQQP
jgi:penicillin-binding protein 2